MKLPYNLELLPGVQQTREGKLFRIGRYPSGKSVMVPYSESGDAERGRTIPVYVEPVKERRVLKLSGPRLKREAHVRFRWNGSEDVLHHTLHNEDAARDVASMLHPLCISPDCGQTWTQITTDYADFYNCWHEDVKEVGA